MGDRTHEKDQEAAPQIHNHDHGHDHDHGGDSARAQSEEAKKTAPSPDIKGKGKGEKKFLDKAASVKVLNDAFGHIKKIEGGDVKVFDQANFKKAWEDIYGETEYAWDTYVVPSHGNLEGFAHEGVNYINSDIASIDTVPHEILHNNDAADWTPFVGSEFNEGTTEYMTIYAASKAGHTPSHSYPSQEGVVKTLVANGLSQESLFKAYLKGSAKTLVGKWVDDNCKKNWADVKTAMQAKDWTAAQAAIKKALAGEVTGPDGDRKFTPDGGGGHVPEK